MLCNRGFVWRNTLYLTLCCFFYFSQLIMSPSLSFAAVNAQDIELLRLHAVIGNSLDMPEECGDVGCPTSWDEFGLKGRVKAIMFSSAEYSSKYGAWAEVEKSLGHVSVFDVQGRQTEMTYPRSKPQKVEFAYDDKGNLVKRLIYDEFQSNPAKDILTYDTNGRLLEEASYSPENTPEDRYTYKYDEFGNVVEYTRYDSEGGLSKRETTAYHAKDGKVIVEASIYGPDGRLESAEKMAYLYENAKLLKVLAYKGSKPIINAEAVYNKDGSLTITNYGDDYRYVRIRNHKGKEVSSAYYDKNVLTYKSLNYYDKIGSLVTAVSIAPSHWKKVTTYDNLGNTVGYSEYDSNGKLKCRYRYAYEVDSNCNWIKQVKEEHVTKFGKQFYEPRSVDYRKIEYYK